MSTTIKPIGMRVLLEREPLETKTASGLYVPDSAASEGGKPRRATVIELGTGTKDEKFRVAVGDKVLVTGYGGVDYTVDGKKYVIINEVDILAIINND